MKLICMAILMATMTVWGVVAPRSETAAEDSGLRFSVEIGSRLYPDWAETQLVALDEDFYLADSEFMAVVRDFLPDFRIIENERLSMSDELNNPAAFIHVFSDSGVVDSTWAFLNFPPHFTAKSFFTFKLLEVVGYAPAGHEEK